MPIRPSERARYPVDWPAISLAIRERAGQGCECRGECGDDHDRSEFDGLLDPGPFRCGAPNGVGIVRHRVHRWRWRTVEGLIPLVGTGGTLADSGLGDWSPRSVRSVLTVAHLDHAPENCDPANLRAMCQRCHLRYDRHHHANTARNTRAERVGLLPLFGGA
jgi:hypothetical protein